MREWCHMKKSVLFLLTLVPVAVGALANVLLTVPVIGAAGFYLLPLVTTAFWIYLGRQYARRWKTNFCWKDLFRRADFAT